MAYHRDSGSGGKTSGQQRFGGPRKPYGGASKSYGSRGPSRGGYGGRDRDDKPMMHSATCAECGSACQVPFKPNGRKPILCSNCFGNTKDSAPRSYGEKNHNDNPKRFAGGDTELKDVLREINNKLDLIIRSIES